MIEIELAIIAALLSAIIQLLYKCHKTLAAFTSQDDTGVIDEESPIANAQMIDLGREDRDLLSGSLTEAQEDELDDLDRKLAEQDL